MQAEYSWSHNEIDRNCETHHTHPLCARVCVCACVCCVVVCVRAFLRALPVCVCAYMSYLSEHRLVRNRGVHRFIQHQKCVVSALLWQQAKRPVLSCPPAKCTEPLSTRRPARNLASFTCPAFSATQMEARIEKCRLMSYSHDKGTLVSGLMVSPNWLSPPRGLKT